MTQTEASPKVAPFNRGDRVVVRPGIRGYSGKRGIVVEWNWPTGAVRLRFRDGVAELSPGVPRWFDRNEIQHTEHDADRRPLMRQLQGALLTLIEYAEGPGYADVHPDDLRVALEALRIDRKPANNGEGTR